MGGSIFQSGLAHLRIGGDALYYHQDLPAPERDRGQCVLVLHGFPDTPESFAPVGKRLAASGYRVLRPYLPGYAPLRFRGWRSIEEARDRLLAFADAAGSETMYLVGHDWGAILSYALLEAAPDRFARAATISVPHLAHLLPMAFKSWSQLRRSFYILFFQLPLLPEQAVRARLRLVERLCRHWSPGFAFAAQTLEEIESCLRASGSAPFSYYRDLPRVVRPGATLWRPITTPLLYLHGRHDGCIGADMASGQERFFRGEFQSQLLECGHFPHLEVPDALADALVRWLTSPSHAAIDANAVARAAKATHQ